MTFIYFFLLGRSFSLWRLDHDNRGLRPLGCHLNCVSCILLCLVFPFDVLSLSEKMAPFKCQEKVLMPSVHPEWAISTCKARSLFNGQHLGSGSPGEVSEVETLVRSLLHCCKGNQFYSCCYFLSASKAKNITRKKCAFQVSLLVVVEIGIFPLICGWWLDICSLVCLYPNLAGDELTALRINPGRRKIRPVMPRGAVKWLRKCVSQEMFDASLKDRELSFDSAPGTTMFLHWLVGMVYVFYFASFILLLREVGVYIHVRSLGQQIWETKHSACKCCHWILKDASLPVRFWGQVSYGSWETSTTPILTLCRRWSTCPYTGTSDGSFYRW